MFRRTNSSMHMESVFVLAILTMFALTSLLLVVFGTRQYKKTVDISNSNYEVRTTSSYLFEKVRSVDKNSSLTVFKEDETSVLALSEEINGQTYVTYLYSYEGYLRELFVAEEIGFTLGAGQTITEISDFTPVIEDGLLKMTYQTSDGSIQECDVNL